MAAQVFSPRHIYFHKHDTMKFLLTFFLYCLPLIVLSQSIKGYQYFKQAIELKNNMKYSESIDKIDKFISLNPLNEDGYGFKASVEQFTNRDDAIRDINKSISINPKFAYSYCIRAELMFSNLNYMQSIEDYTTAINLTIKKEEKAEYYSGRANSRLEMLDYIGALNDCNIAISFYKKPTTFVLINRAKAKINLEDYYGAIKDCNECISISPGEQPKAYLYRAISKVHLKKDGVCEDLYQAKRLADDYEINNALKIYCGL